MCTTSEKKQKCQKPYIKWHDRSHKNVEKYTCSRPLCTLLKVLTIYIYITYKKKRRNCITKLPDCYNKMPDAVFSRNALYKSTFFFYLLILTYRSITKSVVKLWFNYILPIWYYATSTRAIWLWFNCATYNNEKPTCSFYNRHWVESINQSIRIFF